MPATQLPVAPVVKQLEKDFDGAVQRLCDLLRIPSISTDPAYKAQTRQAGKWCADELKRIGFDSTLRDTPGHPMVVAHFNPEGENGRNARSTSSRTNGSPHILYYGHYDVQPPDPLELWEHPPFEPTIVDGPQGKRVVARGAVDDKGQMMTMIEAFRAWMKVHGTLPVRVTVLLEGEEESGSPSLDPFLKANKKELSADVCVVSDTGMWNIQTPAITYMLRGLVYIEATLHGPSHDLHSGMYGGTLVNPINALCKIVGELHDKDRVVQIPGFYDDVEELSDEEKKMWKGLGFKEKEFLGGAGVKSGAGEKGRSTMERMWSRPTCDANGIYGGYTGKGAKTVIAAHATAKISCRLVPSQDPQKVYDGLVKFLKDRTPPDCRWEIHPHGINPAIRVPTESPYLEAAMKGLKQTFSKPPVLIGCGGSIPLVGSVQKILGFDSLLVGFGLEDDRVHSPNEKFELKCYEMG
ncbi:MAG: M20/M25/M40 family metallo-hydrolase, partial [Phycisphaerales bacterium]|nr:M20/M25/M40 family metallo-hydrolase [Phycisphaerales bacterium]